MAKPRSMLRQTIGARKKSAQASQYRVGRYGLTDAAELRATRTPLVISAASAPSAAPRDESVSVEPNSAIDATPSMETPMNATAPSVRTAMSAGVIGVPDSDVATADAARPREVTTTGLVPNSPAPVAYAVTATRITAPSKKAITEIS